MTYSGERCSIIVHECACTCTRSRVRACAMWRTEDSVLPVWDTDDSALFLWRCQRFYTTHLGNTQQRSRLGWFLFALFVQINTHIYTEARTTFCYSPTLDCNFRPSPSLWHCLAVRNTILSVFESVYHWIQFVFSKSSLYCLNIHIEQLHRHGFEFSAKGKWSALYLVKRC